jgi:hypothetical protein
MPRLISIPLTIAGVWLLGLVLQEPLTRLLGTDTTVKVTDVQPSSRNNDGKHFDITFVYDNHTPMGVTGYGAIDTSKAKLPERGQMVGARVLHLGRVYAAALNDGDRSTTGLVCGGIFSAVWCLGVAIFTLLAWMTPGVNRKLLAQGSSASGVVTGKKRAQSGRSVSHDIAYRYKSSDGVERVGSARVSQAIYNAIAEEQAVTVVYRADRPEVSMMYEAADYVVEEGSNSKL